MKDSQFRSYTEVRVLIAGCVVGAKTKEGTVSVARKQKFFKLILREPMF